jgi:arsenate reductase (thioredoxin)
MGCAPLTPKLPSIQKTNLKPVLFVCEHGVAKSALAAALFNDMAKARGLALRAERRAAKTPQIEPSVSTTKGLTADGLPIPEGVPLQLSEQDMRNALRVITLGTSLPVAVPNRATEDWDDVPAVGEGYAAARDTIRRHISKLLDDLAAHPGGT